MLHVVIRGKEIVSNKTSEANRTGSFHGYLTNTTKCVLCGGIKANDRGANIRENCSESDD